MSKKSIVFDFDGTLVDSNAIKNDVFYQVISDHAGAQTHLEKILAAPHGDRNDVFRSLARAIGKTEDWGAQKAFDYTCICEDLIIKAPEILGANEALIKLSEIGFSLHINSATPQPTLVNIVENRGWTPHFLTILGTPSGKTENLHKVMAAYNLRPNDIIMIGDGDNDRKAAKALGIAFIGIATPREEFSGPIESWSANMRNIEHLLQHS